MFFSVKATILNLAAVAARMCFSWFRRNVHSATGSLNKERARGNIDHFVSAARRRAIVAQVEREIARKAFQQHQAKMGKAPAPTSTANLLTLPVAKPESAASAAKRLLAALFSFAMPA